MNYHKFQDDMLLPPSHLAELPVLYCDERPRELSFTIYDAIAALWVAKGNVSKAAEILRISSIEMRRAVHKYAELKETWREIQEQRLDKAEANVREALHDSDPKRAEPMAYYVLRTRGRNRGWGTSEFQEPTSSENTGTTLNITWANEEPGEPPEPNT